MGRPIFLCASALSLFLAPAAAQAAGSGTHFVLELTTGLNEPAFTHQSPGLTAGLSFGTSFKLSFLPVRWYILGTVSGRNASAAGHAEGVAFNLDRKELDVYLSQRLVLPIYGYFRVYGEFGIGQRFTTQTLNRRSELGSISEADNALLLVVAAGVQARFHENFSVGLRGELTPLDSRADLATYAADLDPTPNRVAVLAQLGFHF